MLATKKEVEELKNKVANQEILIQNLQYQIIQLQEEMNEIKQEPSYFS